MEQKIKASSPIVLSVLKAIRNIFLIILALIVAAGLIIKIYSLTIPEVETKELNALAKAGFRVLRYDNFGRGLFRQTAYDLRYGTIYASAL